MTSNVARFAVLAVAVAAAVVLFVVLGGDDDQASTTPASTNATVAGKPANDKPDREKPKPEVEPTVPLIEVKKGQPVGGVNRLEFTSGERLVFDVASDTDMTFHLHGYDVEQSVAAGKTTRFDLPADIEGVFELEEHDLGTPIAEITVAPS